MFINVDDNLSITMADASDIIVGGVIAVGGIVLIGLIIAAILAVEGWLIAWALGTLGIVTISGLEQYIAVGLIATFLGSIFGTTVSSGSGE